MFNIKKLADLRKKKGMTQVALAVAVGVSINSYQKWENGTSKPSALNMIKLEEALSK